MGSIQITCQTKPFHYYYTTHISLNIVRQGSFRSSKVVCFFLSTQLTTLLLIHVDMGVSFINLISFNLFVDKLPESKAGQRTIVYKLFAECTSSSHFGFPKVAKSGLSLSTVSTIFFFVSQTIYHSYSSRKKYQNNYAPAGLREFAISNSWPIIHYNPSPFIITDIYF